MTARPPRPVVAPTRLRQRVIEAALARHRLCGCAVDVPARPSWECPGLGRPNLRAKDDGRLHVLGCDCPRCARPPA